MAFANGPKLNKIWPKNSEPKSPLKVEQKKISPGKKEFPLSVPSSLLNFFYDLALPTSDTTAWAYWAHSWVGPI